MNVKDFPVKFVWGTKHPPRGSVRSTFGSYRVTYALTTHHRTLTR